ncbi:early endosome antigen 1-like protein, partial [Lates japonicus]
PVQTYCASPVFGLWHAPLFPPGASKDRTQIVQGHDVEERAPRSLVHPLRAALLSAQDKIKKLTDKNDSLRRENARLTLREIGSPEDMQELTRLYTRAKTEKEEMETRMKKMEEAFQWERKTWEEMSRQLGERSSLTMKLLVADTHPPDGGEVRESKKGIQEVEREKRRMLSWKITGENRDRAEDAATKLRESEEKWQRRSEKKWERKCNALEENYRKERSKKEDSWQKRVQAMERKNELEMWLQTEEERTGGGDQTADQKEHSASVTLRCCYPLTPPVPVGAFWAYVRLHVRTPLGGVVARPVQPSVNLASPFISELIMEGKMSRSGKT